MSSTKLWKLKLNRFWMMQKKEAMVVQICGTANSTVRISRMRPTVRIVPSPFGSDGIPFIAGPWFTGGGVCCAVLLPDCVSAEAPA